MCLLSPSEVANENSLHYIDHGITVLANIDMTNESHLFADSWSDISYPKTAYCHSGLCYWSETSTHSPGYHRIVIPATPANETAKMTPPPAAATTVPNIVTKPSSGPPTKPIVEQTVPTSKPTSSTVDSDTISQLDHTTATTAQISTRRKEPITDNPEPNRDKQRRSAPMNDPVDQ